MKREWPRAVLVLACLLLLAGNLYAAKTCPNCGAANQDAARFCKNCGYRFEAAPTGRRVLPLLRGRVAVEGGAVEVTSTPSGAQVSINGSDRGRTPLSLEGLPPGQHELELSRSGYRSYYGIFVIPKLLGTIAVTTIPQDAEVLLDGDAQGIAGPAGLVLEDVAYGTHTLTARLAGWEDDVRTVELSAENPVSVITLKLGTQLGFLQVRSTPEAAAVFLEGQKVGVTEYFGAWMPERYRLTLTKKGFDDWNSQVDIRQAETTFVAAGLLQPRGRRPVLLWTGAAALAVGIAGAVVGEVSYRQYNDASPPEYNSSQIADLRKQTQTWDVIRNIGFGLGALSVGAYFAF